MTLWPSSSRRSNAVNAMRLPGRLRAWKTSLNALAPVAVHGLTIQAGSPTTGQS